MDPAANGQLQRQWGWLIAVYLFLGGVGAGAYAIAALNGFLGKEMELSTQIGLWIGFPALLIGSLCLIADLGSPAKAMRAGIKVRTSWIARGTWFISTFMLLSLLHLVLFHLGYRIMGAGAGVLRVIAVLGIITAIGTMAYTGLLLGASKGIPFWRSGMVPALFVISALVTGHCAIMLIMALAGGGVHAATAIPVMANEAATLIVVEVLAIALYLYSAFKIAEARESTERILAKRAFVLGYFVLGLAAPLVVMLALGGGAGEAGAGGAAVGWAALGSALGLVGGLILRWSVLTAGTLPTWHVGGMEFRRIARPKDPKPSIGLMPPA